MDNNNNAEQNREVIRQVYQAFSDRDFNRIDELFSDDYKDHSPGAPGPLGKEEFKQFLQMWFNAFPDARFEIEDIIVEGNKAAWRETMTGTHQGELMGIPPTGKQVRIPSMGFGLIGPDGKALKHWGAPDMMGLMQQLGVIPTPGQQ